MRCIWAISNNIACSRVYAFAMTPKTAGRGKTNKWKGAIEWYERSERKKLSLSIEWRYEKYSRKYKETILRVRVSVLNEGGMGRQIMNEMSAKSSNMKYMV